LSVLESDGGNNQIGKSFLGQLIVNNIMSVTHSLLRN
jgi:hypothetical protein